MSVPMQLRLSPVSAPAPKNQGLPLARKAFRPFFLLAAVSAVLAVPWWVLVLTGNVPAAKAMTPVVWHGHEMLFGYTAAVVAGFLLTAASNWTHRETIVGTPLLLLAGLWLAGRVAMALPLPPLLIMSVDVLFLPAVAVFLARPIVASGNRRNIVMVVLLAVFSLANLLTHLDAIGYAPGAARRGLLLAIDAAVLMMLVMGARVIPMFTRNATRDQSIRSSPKLDRLTVAAFVLAAAATAVLGPTLATSALCVVAGVLALARTRHWGFRRSLSEPMLWVLHVGHAWIGVGLLLRAAALAYPVLGASATHAMTAGAAGTLTLGMMSRVSLGHTGRLITASKNTQVAFLLVTAAAALRISAPLISPIYVTLLVCSATAWSLAFLLFLVDYTPVLLRPRKDGAAG